MVGVLLALLGIYRFLALLKSPVELQLCGSQIPQRGKMNRRLSMRDAGPVDPRVELLTTRSSEAVLSGAAKTTGSYTGRATQHSVIRKRAYRRARRRAEQAGGTFYRGRWMSAESLGTVLRNPEQTDTRPRPKQDLAPSRQHPRLRVRSYNVGGVTSAVYDYLHHWLTTECQDDVLIITGTALGLWPLREHLANPWMAHSGQCRRCTQVHWRWRGHFHKSSVIGPHQLPYRRTRTPLTCSLFC